MFLMLQKTLLPLLAIFMTASLYMIFQYAPKEKIMGDVQRIFYFHMGYVLVFTFAFKIYFSFTGVAQVTEPRLKRLTGRKRGQTGD